MRLPCTLTVLFATTCLLLTNLFADHDYDIDENWAFKDHENPEVRQIVWGEAYASTWYDPPFAKSYQYAYVSNGSDEVPIRCYCTAEGELGSAAPDWSPSGREIAYEKFIDNGVGLAHKNIYLMSVNGDEQRPLFPDPQKGAATLIMLFFPRWSADGQRILFKE